MESIEFKVQSELFRKHRDLFVFYSSNRTLKVIKQKLEDNELNEELDEILKTLSNENSEESFVSFEPKCLLRPFASSSLSNVYLDWKTSSNVVGTLIFVPLRLLQCVESSKMNSNVHLYVPEEEKIIQMKWREYIDLCQKNKKLIRIDSVENKKESSLEKTLKDESLVEEDLLKNKEKKENKILEKEFEREEELSTSKENKLGNFQNEEKKNSLEWNRRNENQSDLVERKTIQSYRSNEEISQSKHEKSDVVGSNKTNEIESKWRNSSESNAISNKEKSPSSISEKIDVRLESNNDVRKITKDLNKLKEMKKRNNSNIKKEIVQSNEEINAFDQIEVLNKNRKLNSIETKYNQSNVVEKINFLSSKTEGDADQLSVSEFNVDQSNQIEDQINQSKRVLQSNRHNIELDCEFYSRKVKSSSLIETILTQKFQTIDVKKTEFSEELFLKRRNSSPKHSRTSNKAYKLYSKQQEKMKTLLLKIYHEILNYEVACSLNKRVLQMNESIILQPMSFLNLKQRIENGSIRNIEEFLRDCFLIISNISMGFQEEEVHEMANNLRKQIKKRIKLAYTEETPLSHYLTSRTYSYLIKENNFKKETTEENEKTFEEKKNNPNDEKKNIRKSKRLSNLKQK